MDGITINRKKVNYIFLLCILSLDYLYNNFFNVIITRDILLILLLLLIGVGFVKFEKFDKQLYSNRNKKYVFLAWFFALISSIIPVYNGYQSYIPTLLAQRSLLAMSFLLLLLKLGPSEIEIVIILKRLSIITVILGVISIFFPYLFMDEIQTAAYEVQSIEGTSDIIHSGIGMIVFTLFFFYRCQKMIEDSSLENIIIASAMLFYLIIFQNRSTLLIALPTFLYAFIKMRSGYKIQFIVIGGTFLFIVFYSYIQTIFINLVEETQTQMAYEGYNRWQAIDFFFTERQYGIIEILFGHGVPSAGSPYLKSLVEASEDRWAFISDIGLLGVFFYYGLLFLCILYVPFVFVVLLRKKNYPFYLKSFALWILCVPTIHCYNLPGSTSFVVYYIFMYLVILYKRKELKLQSH